MTAYGTEAKYSHVRFDGECSEIVGSGERNARRITSALIDRGVLVAESSRAPLRLAFPAALAGRWLPGLFPEQAT